MKNGLVLYEPSTWQYFHQIIVFLWSFTDFSSQPQSRRWVIKLLRIYEISWTTQQWAVEIKCEDEPMYLTRKKSEWRDKQCWNLFWHYLMNNFFHFICILSYILLPLLISRLHLYIYGQRNLRLRKKHNLNMEHLKCRKAIEIWKSGSK